MRLHVESRAGWRSFDRAGEMPHWRKKHCTSCRLGPSATTQLRVRAGLNDRETGIYGWSYAFLFTSPNGGKLFQNSRSGHHGVFQVGTFALPQ